MCWLQTFFALYDIVVGVCMTTVKHLGESAATNDATNYGVKMHPTMDPYVCGMALLFILAKYSSSYLEFSMVAQVFQ